MSSRLLTLLHAICVFVAAGIPALAQTISTEETARLAKARAVIERVDRANNQGNKTFAELLALREELEPVRDDLDAIAVALNQRLKAASARLKQFSTEPAAKDQAQIAQDRKAAQAAVTEIEGHLQATRALLVRVQQLQDEITDARRELFNARLFQHQDSFVYPYFWQRVFEEGLPQFGVRLRLLWFEIAASLDAEDSKAEFLGTGALLIFLAAALWWLRRRLTRSHALMSSSHYSVAPGKPAIVLHAWIDFALHALPFAAAGAALAIATSRLEIGPDTAQYFFNGLAGSLAAWGIGTGAVVAVFAPRAPAFRMLQASDAVARNTVRIIEVALALYLAGIILLGLFDTLSADVLLTIAATGLVAIVVAGTTGAYLLRSPVPGASDPVSGLVAMPISLLRPLCWVMAAVIIAALLFGFIALPGFLIGRFLASVVVICFAVLAYVTIDTVFHDALTPGQRANTAIASTLGITPESVDLAGTIVSGVLRLLVVALTVLTLLSPWGIEFGNLNPFEDIFFGVRFNDLRGWMGAAGIAVVLFFAGLLATRLFIAWLDNQLLPRTPLDAGMRHSIITISGYLGIVAALAIALGQAGVQLQSVALVAGALSVGVGFGLQHVVANFIAGLIVLAERPVRVGDIIVVKGEEGQVRKISVRATELALGENSTIIVPNADIVSSIVKNRSFHDLSHRTSAKFFFAHGVDLPLAFSTLLDIANAHPHVLHTKPPSAFVRAVSETGIEVDLVAMCDRVENLSLVKSDLYREALQRFVAAGIRLAGAGPIASLQPVAVDNAGRAAG